MIAAKSSDGRIIEAFDDGAGPAIFILHGGMDDGRGWKKVAGRLSESHRVLRVRRRPYEAHSPTTMAQEVGDVVAIAKLVDEPKMVFGHSSGGMLALETMVASPELFRAAVIYEPPVVTGAPIGGEATKRVRAAIETDKPAKAMAIFSQHMLRLNPVLARGIRRKNRERLNVTAGQQGSLSQLREPAKCGRYANTQVSTTRPARSRCRSMTRYHGASHDRGHA